MKKIYALLFILLCIFSSRISAQCTTPTNVPYYKNFSGITTNNQLPPCWAISNATTCLTFTNVVSPHNTAAFNYSPAGISYFYSEAIYLMAGITYSLSSWYTTNGSANVTWTDFSMFIGPNQSTTGLTQIASTNGNVTTNLYSALDNTLTVASSGIYYIAVSGTSNGNSSGAPFLYWTNLSLTIPCTPAYNTPIVSIAASSTLICEGSVFLTATGADLYLWDNGATTPNIGATPSISTTYTVIGTKVLTGCTQTATILVNVKPVPAVAAFASSLTICKGSSVMLAATGANTYYWAHGPITSTTSVKPTVTSAYTVVGIATNSCTSMAVVIVTVNPLPIISITSQPSITICQGEEITLTGSGAVTYTWNSGLQGNPVKFTPAGTLTLTVLGTDGDNCTGQTEYVLKVNECTGLVNSNEQICTIKIFPNPGSGRYIIDSGNKEGKVILITDLMGKIVFSETTSEEQTQLDLKDLSNGIYQVKISTPTATNNLRIIKQ